MEWKIPIALNVFDTSRDKINKELTGSH